MLLLFIAIAFVALLKFSVLIRRVGEIMALGKVLEFRHSQSSGKRENKSCVLGKARLVS